jgi:hypothetical protein
MTELMTHHKDRILREGAKEVAVEIAGLCAAIEVFEVNSHF